MRKLNQLGQRDRDARAKGRIERVVTMLGIILPLCRIAGLIFGLLAAYYWFKASRAKVTDKDARYDSRFDFVVNDPEDKGRDTNFLATVLEQSRLNRITAIYSGLAILFQAAASRPLIES
jgi:hypothetical protein